MVFYEMLSQGRIAQSGPRAPKTTPDGLKVETVDLAAADIPDPPQVIAGMLYRSGKLIYGGPSKAHKSWTLIDLCIAVATGGAWLAQLQIDRTAAVARSRWSLIGGGVVEELSGSIAGFGSLDGAAQVFGFGAIPGLAYGCAASWCAVATGAQCEGASFLATMARRLGVE
jgi:hypothetical protein